MHLTSTTVYLLNRVGREREESNVQVYCSVADPRTLCSGGAVSETFAANDESEFELLCFPPDAPEDASEPAQNIS